MTVYELIQQLTKYDANYEVALCGGQLIMYEKRSISVPNTNPLRELKEELEQEL